MVWCRPGEGDEEAPPEADMEEEEDYPEDDDYYQVCRGPRLLLMAVERKWGRKKLRPVL